MIPPNTPEWVKARVGCLTASRMADAMATLKDGKTDGAPRKRYLREILAERMTGYAMDHYVSPAMQHGLEYEQACKDAYEGASGNLILPAGFILHPRIEFFGATPDGLIDDDGCYEGKAPTTDTHLYWLIEGKVPPEYKPQMIAEMLCARRRWCAFASYDPRLPPKKRLFVRHYEPKPEEFAEIESAAIRFLKDVDALWEALHTEAA